MRSSEPLMSICLMIGALTVSACATSREEQLRHLSLIAGEVEQAPPAEPASSDKRVGLGGGWFDAEEAAVNMRLISRMTFREFIPSMPGDFSFMNSGSAFR